MNKVDAAEAVEITTAVARFLAYTKRPRAALQFYKELMALLEFIEQMFNSSIARALMNDKIQKNFDNWIISTFLSLHAINLQLGEHNESKKYAELALAKIRKTGCKKTEKFCLQTLCLCLTFDRNQHDRNTKCLKEILSISEESGDIETQVTACYQLALRHFDVGQVEEAAEFLEKSIQTSRKGGCKLMEVECLAAQALLVLWPGEKNKVFQKLEEALRISEEIGDVNRKAIALYSLGKARHADSRYEEAKEFYENSLQFSAELPYLRMLVFTRLGTVLVDLRQFDEAMKCLHKALEICEEETSAYHILSCKYQIFAVLCDLHLLLGQPEKASAYVNKLLTESWHEKKHVYLGHIGAYIGRHGHFEEACDILAESIKGYENDIKPLNDESRLSVGDVEANITIYKIRCFFY